MNNEKRIGHRQRLKQRFLTKDKVSHTDEEILELLLTYAIPRKDVQPLAKNLLKEYGSFSGVLGSDMETLCKYSGIKLHSAVLLKLVDWIRTYHPGRKTHKDHSSSVETQQLKLFDDSILPLKDTEAPSKKRQRTHRGPILFGKAVLKEAIDILPEIPFASSMKEVTEFLNERLPFHSTQTRARRAGYITFRMFNDRRVDFSLLKFARFYPNSRELQDVCFYRFCKVEEVMTDFMMDVSLKAIGQGTIERAKIREYLDARFPRSGATKDCASAIVEALTGAEIARKEGKSLEFAFRDIPFPSFAFVLHSEFPEPGTYDVTEIEKNTAIRTVLWNPQRILPSLYELKNLDIIENISETDSIKEFTIKWTLDQAVDHLVKRGNECDGKLSR